MKSRVISVLFIVVILGIAGWLTAGSLEPLAAPGPTMKTLDEVKPGIAIGQADMPKTIDAPGKYYLTENITIAETAITVDANDVCIDLGGFSIKGPDSGSNFGIYINNKENVEIRNGTIRDFNYGIATAGSESKGCQVVNINSVSNLGGGFLLSGTGHCFKDCSSHDNGRTGISGGDSCTITGCKSFNNGGLATYNSNIYAISSGKGSNIIGNTVYSNGVNVTCKNISGINAGNGSTVMNNSIYRNGTSSTASTGITGIDGSPSSTIKDNNCYDNGDNASGSFEVGLVIGIRAYTGCTVTGNTCCENGTSANADVYGMTFAGFCLVDQNTAYNNGTGAVSKINMQKAVSGCVYGNNVAP